jgi:large subunit ribosomal protein L4e
MIVSDDIEKVSKASDMKKILDALHLTPDIERLLSRKARSGKSALRGRATKTGRSVLFVTRDSTKLSKACGSFPGVEVCSVKNLSVLDLAPGAVPIRLTVYTKSAIEEISKIKSTHLELMVKLK